MMAHPGSKSAGAPIKLTFYDVIYDINIIIKIKLLQPTIKKKNGGQNRD